MIKYTSFGAVFSTAPIVITGLADDEVKNFLRKGDDDATGKGQEAVAALGGIVALEGQTNLNNTPTKQDQPDGTNESEDEIGQVVYNRDGVAASSKSVDTHAHDERDCENGGCIEAEALFDLDGSLQLLIFVLVKIEILHFLSSPLIQLILQAPLQRGVQSRVVLALSSVPA